MSVRPDRAVSGTTGTFPALSAFGAALAALVLFAFSPTLNPIDILAGRIFEVRVPDVVGLTQTSALVRLTGARLDGHVTFDYSPDIGRGLVMGQDPDASETLRRGSTAEIVVSRGPARVTLPDYTGRSEVEVTAELAEFDITTEVSRVNDEFFPQGSVMTQEPGAGVVVFGGSTVQLVASLGPVTRAIPEVTSLSVEGASFLLGKAGFILGEVAFEENPLVPQGAVIGTDPAAGEVLNRDTPLILRVSAGGPPVPVPDVRNLTQQEASKKLGQLRLVVGEISQVGSIRDPLDGKVLDQVPKPGVRLRPGELVTLTVRRAAPTPPVTTPPTTLPEVGTVTTTTTTTTIAPTTTVAVPGG